MSMENQNDPPKPLKKNVEDIIQVGMEVPDVKLWKYASFAREWFENASKETNDPQAIRREIVFAVPMVESYLYEWVWDEVLGRNFDEINQYFPNLDRRGIKERWKGVIKKLYDDKRIDATPSWGTTSWDQFCKLLKMRDGLVHASASRPATSSQAKEEGPIPSLDDLINKQNGWATGTVVNIISDLHQAVRTDTPKWFPKP